MAASHSLEHIELALDLDLIHVVDVLKRCNFPESRWFELGLRLGLLKTTLDAIEERYGGDNRRCLMECLSKWLSQADNVINRGGPPTWDSLSAVLYAMDETAVASQLDREDCNVQAIAIFTSHHRSLSQSLSDPVSVARLLNGERVITGAVLANIESSDHTLSDKRKVLLAAVREAVQINYQSLHIFGITLCKVTGNVPLGKAILDDYDNRIGKEELGNSIQRKVRSLSLQNQQLMEENRALHSQILKMRALSEADDNQSTLQLDVLALRKPLHQMQMSESRMQPPSVNSSQPLPVQPVCVQLELMDQKATESKQQQSKPTLLPATATSMAGNEYEFSFKIILLGDRSVGKSHLFFQFFQNEGKRDARYTMGLEFHKKLITIDRKVIEVEIWDTAGEERFRSFTRMYYRGAAGALLVYDITDHSTFDNVGKCWLQDLKNYADTNIIVMLIGNKHDLRQKRSVSTDEAKKFAENYNLLFMETSAHDFSNVEAAFNTIITDIYNQVTQEMTTDKRLLWSKSVDADIVSLNHPCENRPLMDEKSKCCQN